MSEWLLVVLFWLAAFTLGYGYAGFPLLVACAGRLLDRRVRQQPVTPRLSVIIAAYNEEEAIRARLEDVLSADYPPDALEVLVASDGSTDSTEIRVADFTSRGVRLLRLPRQGKVATLNEAVKQATGDILVFSDANIQFDPGALRALARNFADPTVGGVAGHTTYRLPADSESSGRGEVLYWRYDTWLKEMESRTGSVVAAHGGLYAVRRELYQAPTEAAVTDDFAISTAVIAQGSRLVFDPEALAYELAIPRAEREFQRKVRLMTRGWRSLSMRKALLNPFRYGSYSLILFSHKVLRRLLPVVLLVLVGSSLLLATRGGLFLAAAGAQALFYGIAVVGLLARGTRVGQLKAIYVPFYFCLANAAALVAFCRFLRGERISMWQPQRQLAASRTR